MFFFFCYVMFDLSLSFFFVFFCFLVFSFFCVLQTVEILDELVEEGSENMDVRNKEQVISRMKAAVASKQFGQEDILSSLVADVISYPALLLFLDYCYDLFSKGS